MKSIAWFVLITWLILTPYWIITPCEPKWIRIMFLILGPIFIIIESIILIN